MCISVWDHLCTGSIWTGSTESLLTWWFRIIRKTGRKLKSVISLSQIHMHSSRSVTIRCIIRTVFSFMCMYIHFIHAKIHRRPLTQWTRAHYCWQTFALEPGAFVYPPALSTEAQFGRGWKRTKRGSTTNSISSEATTPLSATALFSEENHCL